MYIDESGDTTALTHEGKKFLVLAGCIVKDVDRVAIEKDLRLIKKSFFKDEDIEIKSNFLRYANPDISTASPLKLHDRAQYNKLESAVSDYLKAIPVQLISVVIDKSKFWERFPTKNPYDAAYFYLLERYQSYLKSVDGLGICVIDPREGQVEKSFIGDRLEKMHHTMRWDGGKVQCPNVIERLLYSTSEGTIGIQIADLYCYPIFHIYEYGKKPEEYWRYNDITRKKLYSVILPDFTENKKEPQTA